MWLNAFMSDAQVPFERATLMLRRKLFPFMHNSHPWVEGKEFFLVLSCLLYDAYSAMSKYTACDRWVADMKWFIYEIKAYLLQFPVMHCNSWNSINYAFIYLYLSLGATGPSSDFVTISKHVSNNLQWVEIMSKIPKRSEVLGIALTGWSRWVRHQLTKSELSTTQRAACYHALVLRMLHDVACLSRSSDPAFMVSYACCAAGA